MAAKRGSGGSSSVTSTNRGAGEELWRLAECEHGVGGESRTGSEDPYVMAGAYRGGMNGGGGELPNSIGKSRARRWSRPSP